MPEDGQNLNPEDYDADKLQRDIETCKEGIDLNHWDFAQPARTGEERCRIMRATALLIAAKEELESILGAKDTHRP